MGKLCAWLRQPTTVGGVAVLVGTTAACMTHQLDWLAAMPLLAGAATSIAVPDNTAAEKDVEAAVRAAIAALASTGGK